MIRKLAEVVKQDLSPNVSLKEILKAVWKNPVVTAVCPDLVIRLTSLRGEVSKLLWLDRRGNPDDIQVLAVGTTAIPHHLPRYHAMLKNFFKRSAEYSFAAHTGYSYAIGYDLISQGSEPARRKALTLFNEFYGFDHATLEECITNSAIISGGMRGLKDIADGCVLSAKQQEKPHCFIQPDNSFGTWWNIIERPAKNDINRREIYTIPTKPHNKLHLIKEDVAQFYEQNNLGNKASESWYITPVGNPSGTKMDGKQLADVCETILKFSPKAIIILDTVYVRTLSRSDARQLLSSVVKDSKILQRIIFLESFSKSHGLCRERLAIYFSSNPQLFTQLHTANIGFSAGPSEHKDFQFLALGDMSEHDKLGVEDLHEFWKDERKGLFNFMMTKGDLFEPQQPHVRTEDLDNPLGLYILLKAKKGINAQDVLINSGTLGVDTPLASGHYIRFSVGTLLKPTYAKYA